MPDDMIQRPQIHVDPLSLVSLFIQPMCNGQPLSRAATAFVVSKDDKHYLISNWHVLAGRHAVTNQPLHVSGAIPDALLVAYIEPS